MRGTGGLQKLLYLIMLMLGIYIVYKAGCILLDSDAMQRALDSGEIQRNLEDAAMRTYAPGYTAAVEGRDMPDWLAKWMRQVVPAYSYLAEDKPAFPETVNQSPEQPTETSAQEAGEIADETRKITQEETAAPDGSGMTEIQVAGAREPKQPTETSAQEVGEGAGRAGQPTETSAQTAGESIGGAGQPAETSGQAAGESIGGAGQPAETSVQEVGETQPAASRAVVSEQLLAQLEDFDYLLSHYYTVDEGTMADAELLDADVLLQKDLRLARDPSVPQILIYHTHSQETFADSREGEMEDTIVGMGETLAGELHEAYGYQVIHDTGVYDLVDGVLDRSAAYDYARKAVEQILKEYPTIEVIIDLHRDGVEGEKFVTEIDGTPVSRIMFFNGISRDSADQPLPWLENPYLQDNLAFSLQLQLAAEELFPGFTRNIYLKAERFNLHLRPRSLLIEAGTQLNTVAEERGAMRPLAALLNHVLNGS